MVGAWFGATYRPTLRRGQMRLGPPSVGRRARSGTRILRGYVGGSETVRNGAGGGARLPSSADGDGSDAVGRVDFRAGLYGRYVSRFKGIRAGAGECVWWDHKYLPLL